MIPATFTYHRPGTVDETMTLLAEYGDEVKILAGGHSLLPLMKLRLAVPEFVIDVGRLRELSYVRDEGDVVAIGALTRHRDLETSDVLAREAPLLSYAAGFVGDPQVRHRGTIGGSLAHGDPASDLPAVVLAMDGVLVVGDQDRTREILAADFFQGLFETALQPDELLTEIRIPKQRSRGWAFEKFNQRAIDWAVVGVAVSGDDSPSVALVNMDAVPVRATAVERALADGGSVADAAALAADGTEPPSDLGASSDYRRHLATVLVRRAVEAARRRAQS